MVQRILLWTKWLGLVRTKSGSFCTSLPEDFSNWDFSCQDFSTVILVSSTNFPQQDFSHWDFSRLGLFFVRTFLRQDFSSLGLFSWHRKRQDGMRAREQRRRWDGEIAADKACPELKNYDLLSRSLTGCRCRLPKKLKCHFNGLFQLGGDYKTRFRWFPLLPCLSFGRSKPSSSCQWPCHAGKHASPNSINQCGSSLCDVRIEPQSAQLGNQWPLKHK